MNIVTTTFYVLEALAAISALGILLVRNVFYGVLLLIVCLLSVAGLYVIAFAEFVAMTQILIYVGGVLILIIFGVMVTSRISGKPIQSKNRMWFTGILPGAIIFGLLVKIFSETDFTRTSEQGNFGSIESIGIAFMTDYLFEFEVAGLLLLVVLVAAAVTASMATKKE